MNAEALNLKHYMWRHYVNQGGCDPHISPKMGVALPISLNVDMASPALLRMRSWHPRHILYMIDISCMHTPLHMLSRICTTPCITISIPKVEGA